jgi:Reverse transcriptase (RNA-dependent DNA polymerase)
MRPGSREFMDTSIGHLRNCPVTKHHIQTAEDIFGPNLGSLKGKTTYRAPGHVTGHIVPVPPAILAAHRNVTVSVDIMYINKVTFLLTYSRSIRFGTVEMLPDRQLPTIRAKIQSVFRLYRHRGFHITTLFGDPEFEPLRAWFPCLNTCGADDHIPDIERFIRTVKDRTRSTYRMLPFKHIPRIVLIHLVKNVVFWLNSFPARDGVSNDMSPRCIMTGKEIDYNKHVRLEFGEYVQTHEEHDNSMIDRTLGAICLGPTGNEHGTHWFMCVASGARIARTRWTALPMPKEVIQRVSGIGRRQGMPVTLTFGDRHAREIEDNLADLEDYSDDGSYGPSEFSEEDDAYSYDESSDDDDDNDDNNELPDNLPEPGIPGDDYDEQSSDDDDDEQSTEEQQDGNDSVSENEVSDENTGVDDENAGVDPENTGVEVLEPIDEDNDDNFARVPTAYEQFKQAEQDGRDAATSHGNNYRTRSATRTEREAELENAAEFVHNMFQTMDPTAIFELMSGNDAQEMLSFLTAQMTAKAGLKYFGQDGTDAIMKELEQLLYRKVMEGCHAGDLTKERKKAALKYLMFLKQKRCGKVKGRGCADGRKQRLYKTKEETSSPTISIEALFLTCMIDALERRCVVTCDIPGAFMHADIDELIHIKLEGELADLLIRLDPTYQQFATMEHGKRVIYAKLNKALYGTLQASLLFWKKFKTFLTDLGFEDNPYDSCVMNKMVNNKQCTIGWYVDDLKISHVEEAVVEEIVAKLQEEYGKEAPISVNRGKVQDYLGMKIDFSNEGKVIFSMKEYIKGMLEECPEELLKAGAAKTPAASHLFEINEKATKLDDEKAEIFHHLVAKLLYLSKRTRPDLLITVAFLTTRVCSPDIDDWKKLARCLCYLKDNQDLDLTLEASSSVLIHWWIDAAFGVHPDFKSHTGAAMSLGKGCPINVSSKQRINTRSSTEAELVGVNDIMTLVLWVRLFLEAQGIVVVDNIIYQDNQSTMLLEKNGRQSSGKKTRHFEIRYYFIHDHIKRGTTKVEYCPTDLMVGDFHTKPLQGSAFRKHRALIMNLPPGDPVTDTQECVESSGETSVTQTESRQLYMNEVSSQPRDQQVSWCDVVRKRRKPLKERRNNIDEKLTLLRK